MSLDVQYKQLSLFDYFEEDIEKMDNIEILNRIETATDLKFYNIKKWKSGDVDYWVKHFKAKLSISFSTDYQNKKIILVDYDTKNGGCGMPCYNINEAAHMINNYKKWAVKGELK